MTLKEILGKENKDQLIKIGTKYGSGFFWCGRVSEFEEEVETFNMLFAKSTEEAAKRQRSLFVEVTSKFTASSTRAVKDKDSPVAVFAEERIAYVTEDIREAFNSWLFNCTIAANKMKEADDFVQHPVLLMDREVSEVFMASEVVESESTVVIIINGYENGKFWTIDEAKAYDKTKKKSA